MEFDYIGFINNKFAEILNREEFKDFNIGLKVSDEQQFVKDKDKQPDTIYIVVKQFNGPNSFNVRTVPYQILVLSEQNQLEIAKALCNIFVEENNFATSKDGNTFVKHSYQQPSVMSNFNQIDVGVRSILYIPATLQIMEGLMFTQYGSNYNTIGYIVIGEYENEYPTKVLGLSLDYSMTPNPVQNANLELMVSEKTNATLSLSFNIPLYNNSPLVWRVLSVMNGSISGNSKFHFRFKYVGTYNDASYEQNIDDDFVLISAHIEETPDQAPSLRLGFMV